MQHNNPLLLSNDIEENWLRENTKPIQLTKTQLQGLISQEQYAAYQTARNCYIASIPVLSLAGSAIYVSGIFLGLGIRWDWAIAPLGAIFAATLISSIPGIVLLTYGIKRLNKIASDYNFQHGLSYQPEIKLNIGIVGSGIGLKLTF